MASIDNVVSNTTSTIQGGLSATKFDGLRIGH